MAGSPVRRTRKLRRKVFPTLHIHSRRTGGRVPVRLRHGSEDSTRPIPPGLMTFRVLWFLWCGRVLCLGYFHTLTDCSDALRLRRRMHLLCKTMLCSEFILKSCRLGEGPEFGVSRDRMHAKRHPLWEVRLQAAWVWGWKQVIGAL